MASSNSCSLTENAPSDGQKVMIIEELVQGRELATQLRALLAGAGESSGEISAGDLVSRIMKSFTNSLLLLDQNDVVKNENDTISSSPADSRCVDGRKSEDSEESNCRSASSPAARAPKDRRGSYKRRKTSNTRVTETPTLIDDGHAWRKYGQKDILNAEYPRNYFRCTHKFDQKCQANKHVQRIQKDPPMFRTTYFGNHTCRSPLNGPDLVLDCTSPTQNSSFLLSFNTANNDLNNLTTKHPFFSSSFTSTSTSTTPHVKQEFKDNHEILAADNILPYNCDNMMSMVHDGSNSVSTDYLVLPNDHEDDDDHDLRAEFDQSVLSSSLKSDFHDDVIDIDQSFEDDVLPHLNFLIN